MNNESRITDIVDFNPPRKLKKGQIAPFIDMAALPTNERDIVEITEKAFTGGAKFRNGDTLFARITPCLENGKTGKVSNLSDEVIGHGSTEFIVMTAKDSEIDEDYVYYLARLPEFRKFAQMRMTGTSGRQRVSWQDLAEFTFAFPEPEKRKAAGVFLKTIDDKIQLNTQTNQTLEQIAQTIYKSWFVEYEPTRAKAAVLAAGGSKAEAETAAMTAISGKTAAELAALAQNNPARYQKLADLAASFPAVLTPTDDFGEIPAGWEVCTLKECSRKIQNGGTPKRGNTEFWDDGTIPWLSSGEVCNNKILIKSKEFITQSGLDNSSAKLVPSHSTLVAIYASPTAGKCSFCAFESTTNQAVCAVVPKSGYQYFNYFYLQRQEQYYVSQASGSAQQNISKKIVEETPIFQPTKEILSVFNKIIQPIMNKQISNLIENNKLEETRDSLLPKLLNGELKQQA